MPKPKKKKIKGIVRLNRKLDKFVKYTPDPSWRITKWTALGWVCDCAACGNQIKYGQKYASVEIRDELGYYMVCPRCHRQEMLRAGLAWELSSAVE